GVLLALWVLIERHTRAPMLDLSIFDNRLFAAASAASFINGLARFALMFLFVFYFQGAQSNSPIEAGIKLMPLALGMLVASPLAGIYADRHGSGMLNSPNTAAMMGTVPAQRRGIAAGARTLLQNTGAVLSIAFVLAIVTSAVPKATLFAVFSGVTRGLSEQKLAPFIANMHVALWVLVATSVVDALVCLLRPTHATLEAEDEELRMREQQRIREGQPEHDAPAAVRAGARA